MKIGILGGTFDPPHFAHKEIAVRAKNQFGLSKVVFIPTGNPWQKSPISNSEHRYNMTNLLIEDTNEFEVSRIELDSSRETYTIDTLKELNYDSENLFFILGADTALGIKSWKSFLELGNLCQFLIAPRHGVDKNKLGKEFPFDYLEIAGSELDISSTNVRELLIDGKNLNKKIPTNILEYIQTHSLY